ncbi:MAG: ceramide glucosyltransferase [Hyphomicrobiales bacterium]|nr:ceramide glucosyltransferase [Hyphomicrobiales bacterium]
MLLILSAGIATAAILVQYTTAALAGWRLTAPSRVAPMNPMPFVSLVRPLCGVEEFSVETLACSFALSYSRHEVIFCVADARDPIIPFVRSAMASNPGIAASLLIGRETASGNPKLDNLAKGFRAAAGEIIVFTDSNLLLPADYLERVVSSWRPGIGLVSAPPFGSRPEGFWGGMECAILNTHAARWQYAVDAVGYGFAQGKTLAFRKSDLDRGGFVALGAEPAEDAAATKFVRARGKRVGLVAPAFAQPIGHRRARDVWARHLRWSRLRRATFPHLFVPECLIGFVVPVAACMFAAQEWALSPLAAGLGFACVWFVPEVVLGVRAGWPMSPRMVLMLPLRDGLLLLIWLATWFGRGFVWRGHDMRAARAAEH